MMQVESRSMCTDRVDDDDDEAGPTHEESCRPRGVRLAAPGVRDEEQEDGARKHCLSSRCCCLPDSAASHWTRSLLVRGLAIAQGVCVQNEGPIISFSMTLGSMINRTGCG